MQTSHLVRHFALQLLTFVESSWRCSEVVSRRRRPSRSCTVPRATHADTFRSHVKREAKRVLLLGARHKQFTVGTRGVVTVNRQRSRTFAPTVSHVANGHAPHPFTTRLSRPPVRRSDGRRGVRAHTHTHTRLSCKRLTQWHGHRRCLTRKRRGRAQGPCGDSAAAVAQLPVDEVGRT